MRILSIQSHVVSGYVGNRAATFPLQLLGHDVDVINTVQFSNHTGYGHTDGHKTTPEQLEAIFSGLKKNELDKYDRVLTGYIPGAAALSVVKAHVEGLKPEVYLLDPVMGDIGTGLYVSPDVVPVYKSMLRDATIITPNHFELELLSGVKISTFDDLRKALTTLHEEIPHIAVSSISLPRRLLPDLPPPPTAYTALVPENADWYSAIDRNPENVLVCVASSKSKVFVFALPTIDAYFSGVGDLFAALVLGFFAGDLAQAVGKALYAVQMVLLRTHLNPNQATNMRARELRLVQEQEHIRSGLEWPGIHV